MMSKRCPTALAVAALAAPAIAAASDPAPRPEALQQRSVRSETSPRRDAPPELICRSVEIAGPRDPMVCMSAADWRRAEQ